MISLLQDNELDVNTRLMLEYKCKNDLLFHTRYFYYVRFKKKYKVLRHHQKIANALERVLRGELKKLLIAVGPRLGKTELVVKNLISHGLSLNPAAKFIHLTASDNLALDNSEGAKDIVRLPEYKTLFPNVRIKQASDSKKKWYTTAGGGVYATAAGGQVTGFGAGAIDYGDLTEEMLQFLSDIERKEKFGGAIIYDDSIKPDDAESEIIRGRVNRKFTSTVQNRRNSINTPIIVLQQRLHPDDLIGYLLETEPGDWEIINLETLYEDEEGHLQSLDPSIYPVKELEKMRDSENEEMRIFFQRQLQQNPKSREGLMFPIDGLNFYNPETVDIAKLSEYRAGFCDPADEGGDSLSFPGGYIIGDKIYIPDVIYNTKGTDVNEPACVNFIMSHALNAVQIESNSAWILFRKNVKRLCEEAGSICGIRSVKNTTNKHTRILEASAFIRTHFVFRSDWKTYSDDYRKFMQNLTEYMEVQSGTAKNKHDDAPDSCAGLAKFLRTTMPHIWAPKKQG